MSIRDKQLLDHSPIGTEGGNPNDVGGFHD